MEKYPGDQIGDWDGGASTSCVDEQPTFIIAMTSPAISYLLGHFSSLMSRNAN